MAKYGKKAQDMVKRAMKKKKQGTLKSGSGKKVTSRKQAIAIGLSEARKKGGKVPPKKSRRPAASRKKNDGEEDQKCLAFVDITLQLPVRLYMSPNPMKLQIRKAAGTVFYFSE